MGIGTGLHVHLWTAHTVRYAYGGSLDMLTEMIRHVEEVAGVVEVGCCHEL